jgi:hypothetical protein
VVSWGGERCQAAVSDGSCGHRWATEVSNCKALSSIGRFHLCAQARLGKYGGLRHPSRLRAFQDLSGVSDQLAPRLAPRHRGLMTALGNLASQASARRPLNGGRKSHPKMSFSHIVICEKSAKGLQW